MHKIITDQMQPKQQVSFKMTLPRSLVWAESQGNRLNGDEMPPWGGRLSQAGMAVMVWIK
jgi:hypothetical protein